MSAWRIGADATLRPRPATMVVRVPSAAIANTETIEAEVEVAETPTQSTADLVQKAADVYTKWIPGDVLAIYLALTTAFRGTLGDDDAAGVTPHAWGLLITGICLGLGLSLLGAVAANLKETDATKRVSPLEIIGRMGLASLAFIFWSLTVPGSWWEVKGWDQGVLAAVAFAISIVFALVAEISVAILKTGKP